MDHPKVAGLSDRAFRLWFHWMTWCSRHLTDGVIPRHLWERHSTTKARLELVTAGLVSVANDQIVIHDYLEHQRSSEQVSAIRDSKQRAASLGNHNRWHKARGLVDPSCQHCHESAPPTSHNSSHVRSQPDPIWDRTSDRKTSPVSVTETEVLTQDERGGGLGRRASDNPPPPPIDPYRCPRHQDTDGDPGPCRPCRDARLRQEALAQMAKRDAFQADRNERVEQARIRAAATAACGLCDEAGYRGRLVCDHIERPARLIAVPNPGATA